MEVGTQQSKTAVNANAKAGMPMDTSVAGSTKILAALLPKITNQMMILLS